MTVQLHVSYSSVFSGVGVVAGGPYYCAQGSKIYSYFRCMCHILSVNVSTLIGITRQWSRDGLIDSVDNLRSSHVYIFNGIYDTIIAPAIGFDLRDYYTSFGTSIYHQNTILAVRLIYLISS